jgi:hypothetical protein
MLCTRRNQICPESSGGRAFIFPRIRSAAVHARVGCTRTRARKSIRRFKDQVRQRTQRCVPLPAEQLMEALNPLLRGWGGYYKGAHVRRLFHQLDRWIVRRVWSHRCKRGVTPVGSNYRSLSLRRVRAGQPDSINSFSCFLDLLSLRESRVRENCMHGLGGGRWLGSTGNGLVPVPADISQGGLRLSTVYQGGVQLSLPLRNRIAQADAARDQIQLRQAEGAVCNWKMKSGSRLSRRRSRLRLRIRPTQPRSRAQLLQAEKDKFSVDESTNFLIVQDQDLSSAGSLDRGSSPFRLDEGPHHPGPDARQSAGEEQHLPKRRDSRQAAVAAASRGHLVPSRRTGGRSFVRGKGKCDRWGCAPSISAQVRFGEPGAPVVFLRTSL